MVTVLRLQSISKLFLNALFPYIARDVDWPGSAYFSNGWCVRLPFLQFGTAPKLNDAIGAELIRRRNRRWRARGTPRGASPIVTPGCQESLP